MSSAEFFDMAHPYISDVSHRIRDDVTWRASAISFNVFVEDRHVITSCGISCRLKPVADTPPLSKTRPVPTQILDTRPSNTWRDCRYNT